MDSYQKFLSHFEIDKQALFDWGIEATIFPPIEKVIQEWEALKTRVLTNQPVYIRGYGRDGHGTQLYKDLYRYLFGNEHVEKDPTNNAVPQKCIQRTTGLKRNTHIYNYQVSHIWGHTKNVFLFEAPWNICYTPKLMDPFTGHETKGSWPEEYQKIFLEKAFELYQPFVADYNNLMRELGVHDLICQYIASKQGIIPSKDLAQFEKDVRSEFQPL
jgi:hypothetical protein